MGRKHNGFISQGDLKALTAGQSEPPLLAAKAAPLQPPHATTQFHRLAVDAMIAPEVCSWRGTSAEPLQSSASQTLLLRHMEHAAQLPPLQLPCAAAQLHRLAALRCPFSTCCGLNLGKGPATRLTAVLHRALTELMWERR